MARFQVQRVKKKEPRGGSWNLKATWGKTKNLQSFQKHIMASERFLTIDNTDMSLEHCSRPNVAIGIVTEFGVQSLN